MKILITGGAGFIGSHTASMLAKRHHAVMVLDNFRTGSTENLKGVQCRINICDIIDLARLENAFYDFMPDVVIHLAAQSAITTSLKSPELDVKINVLGTLNVVSMCKKYNVKRLIFSSTSAVYREKPEPWFSMKEYHPCQPSSPYGIDKLAAEHFIRSLFPNHVIFRYGNVYGPRQKPIGENQVVARALRHFLHGDDFSIVGSGDQKRDFTFVEDVAFANCEAVTHGHGTYNLCSGKSHSVNYLLSLIEDYYEVRGYNWKHTHNEDPRGSVYLNNANVRREFGMFFTGLEKGIVKTIEAEDNRKP